MANTAILAIKIISDAAKAKKDLDATATAAEKFGSGMKKAAVPAAAAGGALVLLGKSAVDSASKAQQSLGATQQIFGKYSKSVITDSNKAATTYGLSANQYRESANLIGSLFKNQGVASDQLAGKTKSMISTASDLSAVFGGSTSDAVEALSSAFKGEFDPLEKYGISLKQSTVNSEAFAIAGVKTQSAFNKLSVAQQRAATQQATTNLIMKQSKDAQGQFAAQTNTLAEKQQIAAAQIENLKVKLGNSLLPTVTTGVSDLSKLVSVTSKHATATKILLGVVGGLAAAILGINGAMKVWTAGTTAAAAVQKLWNSTALLSVRVWAIDAAGWVRSTAVRVANTVATKANTAAEKAGNAARTVGSWAADAAGWVKSTAARVANTAATTANTVAEKSAQAARAVGTWAADAAAWITSTAARVANTTATIANTVAQKAAAVASKAWAAAQWLLNAALDANPIMLVVIAIAALVAAFVIAWKNSATFRAIVIGAFNAVKAAVLAVVNWFRVAIPAAWSFIVAAVRVYVNVYRSVITTVFNAVKTVVSAVVNAIRSTVTKAWSLVVSGVRAYVNAYRTVITSVFNAVRSVVSNSVGAVRSVVSGAWNSVRSVTSSAWHSVSSAVSSGVSTAIEHVRELPSRAMSAVAGAAGGMYNAGAKLISGLVDGIGSKINAAISKVEAGVSKIKGLLPGSPIKWGPLKSWNNGGAGKRLMSLLASGIDKGADQAQAAMSSAATQMAGVSFSVPGVTVGTAAGTLAAATQPTVTTTPAAGTGTGDVTIELTVGNEYLGSFVAKVASSQLNTQARRIVAGVNA